MRITCTLALAFVLQHSRTFLAQFHRGAFTKALLEGLKGEADYTEDGAITVNELELYIAERVKVLTGGEQTPTMSKPQTIPDFPLAVSG